MSTAGAAAIGIVVGLMALSLVVMVVWFARKRKKRVAGLGGGYGMSSPYASSQESGSSFIFCIMFNSSSIGFFLHGESFWTA